MLREIGLVLFLASVGIKAGAGFWDTIISGDGLKYVYTGFLITVIPILIIGPIAKLVYKFNYFMVMGMLAGTYTDPPALAYANQVCSREAPGVGYSTVYPLSMFLRILLWLIHSLLSAYIKHFNEKNQITNSLCLVQPHDDGPRSQKHQDQ